MRAIALIAVALSVAASVSARVLPRGSASACDDSTELSVVVNYDYPAYQAMGTTLECVDVTSGAVRVVANFSDASGNTLVATGTPFTPNFGSSMQYVGGRVMIPMSVVDSPGGFYEAVAGTWSSADGFVWTNSSYGYSLQPDEFLLYTGGGGSPQVIGGVTFAPDENAPFAKHLFRYRSIDSADAPDWFLNVTTPVGGFFVGVCAAIDQAKGLYHFVSTDTSSATIFSVDLKSNKVSSAPSNDYGPEMTSLTWNAADGKLYVVAQTDYTTVDVLTVEPKDGSVVVLSSLDLSAHDGLTFQDPAAFNFDAGVVSLMVNYGGSSDADAAAACPTNAVYTWNIQTGELVSSADVKTPTGLECVWTPVTQQYNTKDSL